MWKHTACFILALFTACAEMPPSRGVSIPGAPPQRILLELASEVEHRPYPPEVLSDPVFQAVIAQCEQQVGMHCRESTVPANSRTKFVRTQDDKLIAFVQLGGLERDRDYAVRFLLFDPDGNMRSRASFLQHIPSAFPPDAGADYTFTWTPYDQTAWQLGKWRIEIAVNGQVEVERTFEVIESKLSGESTAPVHTPVAETKVIGRDGTFIAYANGVVKDTKTGLEWIAGPDRNTSWNDAVSWVVNLNVDGGGWRMPTINELEILYQQGVGTRNITPLLKTTGWWLWSGQTTGSTRAYAFSIGTGAKRQSNLDRKFNYRCFAVRSQKK